MGERFLNEGFARTGVSSGTAWFLIELRGGGSRGPAELARTLGVDKAHATRALRSLAASGLVALDPDPLDGRRLEASLTARGRKAADASIARIAEWVALVTEGVAPADILATNRAFDRFYANAVGHFEAP